MVQALIAMAVFGGASTVNLTGAATTSAPHAASLNIGGVDVDADL